MIFFELVKSFVLPLSYQYDIDNPSYLARYLEFHTLPRFTQRHILNCIDVMFYTYIFSAVMTWFGNIFFITHYTFFFVGIGTFFISSEIGCRIRRKIYKLKGYYDNDE